jgi:hypothetical protein
MLILACTIMVLLAGFYVLMPLFKEPKGNLEVELLAETELDRLLNQKAVVYSNLKDLEFEYKMGRLADADFRRLEAGYKSEAAIVLQKMDMLGAGRNIDETIEQDIAARKAKLFSPDAPRRMDSTRCPSCGADIIPGKKFCTDCGKPI